MRDQIAATFLFFLCFGGGAHAQCVGRFDPPTSADIATYDPFAPTDVREQKQLAIVNLSDRTCYFRVYFIADGETGFFSPELRYSLTDSANRNLFFSGSVSHDSPSIGSILLTASNRGFLQYDIQLERGQLISPGSYSDSFEAVLVSSEQGPEFDLDTAPEVDRATLNLSVDVKSVGSLSITGGSLSTTVQFDKLQTGKARSLILEARSNAAYDLTFSSFHGGQMSLDPPIAGQSWDIPYSISVDGSEVDIGQSFVLPQQKAADGMRSHVLDFVILDAASRRAGIYKDVITGKIVPKY